MAMVYESDDATAQRPRRVRLFVSHAHRDVELAAKLVDLIASGLEVPAGELRCTSVPGYKLDLGTMAPDALRRELGSAACVLALLTPHSVGNEWVLFELGAAWATAKAVMPLLAGGLRDHDIPGPLHGTAGGQLASPETLDGMLVQLERLLGWRRRDGLVASGKRDALAADADSAFPRGSTEQELKASFSCKRAGIGIRQQQLLDHVAARVQQQPYVLQSELSSAFKDLAPSLYYRLEQLRLLRFLDRVQVGQAGITPTWAWTLASDYRRERNL